MKVPVTVPRIEGIYSRDGCCRLQVMLKAAEIQDAIAEGVRLLARNPRPQDIIPCMAPCHFSRTETIRSERSIASCGRLALIAIGRHPMCNHQGAPNLSEAGFLPSSDASGAFDGLCIGCFIACSSSDRVRIDAAECAPARDTSCLCHNCYAAPAKGYLSHLRDERPPPGQSCHHANSACQLSITLRHLPSGGPCPAAGPVVRNTSCLAAWSLPQLSPRPDAQACPATCDPDTRWPCHFSPPCVPDRRLCPSSPPSTSTWLFSWCVYSRHA